MWWRRLKPLIKMMNLVSDLDLAFEEINTSFAVASSMWMHAAVKLHQDADCAKQRPWEELRAYLSSLLEDTENVVLWWGISIVDYLEKKRLTTASSIIHYNTLPLCAWPGTTLWSKAWQCPLSVHFLVVDWVWLNIAIGSPPHYLKVFSCWKVLTGMVI